MGWIIESPRRILSTVEPAVIEFEGEHFPMIAMAFQAPDVPDITVGLVCTELELRRFQQQIDKAITEALRTARGTA